MVEEDPSLEFLRNDETKEMLLSGVGQVHIDATLEKLRRKYGVDVNLHMPKVPYKETINRMAQAQGKYKKTNRRAWAIWRLLVADRTIATGERV